MLDIFCFLGQAGFKVISWRKASVKASVIIPKWCFFSACSYGDSLSQICSCQSLIRRIPILVESFQPANLAVTYLLISCSLVILIWFDSIKLHFWPVVYRSLLFSLFSNIFEIFKYSVKRILKVCSEKEWFRNFSVFCYCIQLSPSRKLSHGALPDPLLQCMHGACKVVWILLWILL